MKKHVSSIITTIVIVAVIAALIVGGLALIHVGDTPIYIQFCNILGWVFFVAGGIAAIVVLVIIVINISDYVHPPNGKRN